MAINGEIELEPWFDVHTLIWLFPIVFMLHDFEEIIMVETWIKKNTELIYNKLPKRLADRVIKQFSMTTAQFSVSVLIIFLFGSTFMASQYLHQGPLANIYFFMVCILVFFLHVFTHIGQSVALRSVTPGVITSIFVVFPYGLIVLHTLFTTGVITWSTILLSLPFTLLIFPVVLTAHWIGKKVA
jgi:hypothetical protein